VAKRSVHLRSRIGVLSGAKSVSARNPHRPRVSLGFSQQLRQLRDIGRDPLRLIARD
jgi:hypothetical protein